jgi:hypothetical protein
MRIVIHIGVTLAAIFAVLRGSAELNLVAS